MGPFYGPVILEMGKPACAVCGKIVDIWVLPGEGGPFYCGEKHGKQVKGSVLVAHSEEVEGLSIDREQ